MIRCVLTAFILTVATSGANAVSLGQCRKASQAATKACRSEVDKAKASAGANAAAAGQRCKGGQGKKGQGMSGCAGGLADSARYNSGVLGGAMGSCDKVKKSCDSECDENKAANSAEKEQIKKLREACNQSIEKDKAEAGQGKSDADQAANESDKSKESSGGGGGGSPQTPAKSDDKKKEDTAAEPQSIPQNKTAEVNCDDPSAAANPKCAKQLADKCVGEAGKQSESCRAFFTETCADGSKAASCKSMLTKRFCSDPAKANCPRCLDERGIPASARPRSVPKGCEASDPVYAVPALRESVGGGSAPPSTATPPAGGGGSLGSLAGAGEPARLVEESVKPAVAGEPTSSAGERDMLSGAGGGGFSYGGGSGGAGDLPGGAALDAGGRSFSSLFGLDDPARRPSDVEFTRVAPHVFVILGEVVRTRCSKGLFLHRCDPGGK